MNIIEKEIEKRQNLINAKQTKVNEANALRDEAGLLDIEAAGIDVNSLSGEIAELKTYLPQTVSDAEVVEQSDAEINTAETATF